MKRTLYGFPFSGNTHRVRLMLSILGLAYDEVTVNLVTGEHRKADFLKINPAGQVPVFVEGDMTLFDSHAILVYLAEHYGKDMWWPAQASERAAVLQWLFLDSNEIHNGIGYARNHIAFGVPGDTTPAIARAKAVMVVLEKRLSDRQWLESDRATLADIACYPLVSLAGEASIDLNAYPAIATWMRSVEGLPGYVPTPRFKM